MGYYLLDMLARECCVEILRDIAENEGHNKSWYAERQNCASHTAHLRMDEMLAQHLVESRNGKRHNSKMLYMTAKGRMVLKAVRELEML